MILECVLGVMLFVVPPVLVVFLVPCYRMSRRFRSSIWFEIWVKWRVWRLTGK